MDIEENEYLKWSGTFSLVGERQKHLSVRSPFLSLSHFLTFPFVGGSMNSCRCAKQWKGRRMRFVLSFSSGKMRSEMSPFLWSTRVRKQRFSYPWRNDPSDGLCASRVSCLICYLFVHNIEEETGKRNQLSLRSGLLCSRYTWLHKCEINYFSRNPLLIPAFFNSVNWESLYAEELTWRAKNIYWTKIFKWKDNEFHGGGLKFFLNILRYTLHIAFASWSFIFYGFTVDI